MNPSLAKREANRQRWFDRIETWKQSGLTQKAFCEQQQLGREKGDATLFLDGRKDYKGCVPYIICFSCLAKTVEF